MGGSEGGICGGCSGVGDEGVQGSEIGSVVGDFKYTRKKSHNHLFKTISSNFN